MASKDNKTSKTARVMNLLSKKSDPASAGEPAEDAPAPAAPVHPIVASMAPDAAVSVQIKNALEDALADELGPQHSVAQPEPEPPVQPQPVAQPQPEPPAQSQPVAQPEPEPPAQFHPMALVPENPGYINVMQVLVEEKAPKYIKMFGLCNCQRCLADVKAYTLNHLPSKYVVLEWGDMVPRLTVYEGKFSSDITAQLLQACKVVMEKPHHNR